MYFHLFVKRKYDKKTYDRQAPWLPWRILSGLELFKEVILDFKDVAYIWQAFGDEIFRVFPNINPCTKIIAKNANDDVQYMINRAINTKL